MMWMCVDMTTYDMPAQLHIAFRGIREYQFRYKNALPPLNDDQAADEVFALATNINTAARDAGEFYVETLNEGIVRFTALYARA
jgi:ubiquitin-activating enzyme E1